MPTKQPRINAVLEPPLYDAVRRLAKRNGLSLSQELRELVLRALELIEDDVLAEVAEDRRKRFDRHKALTVEEMRRRLKLG